MTKELHTYYCKDCFKKQEQIDRLEQENKDLKKQIESDKGLITVGGKQQYEYLQRIDELEQENEELKKQHYEALKMLKHEYDGRQRDNEQWFTRCTENHNEDSKIIEKYRSALEEIREIVKPYLTDCQGSLCEPIDEVLNKINECLGE